MKVFSELEIARDLLLEWREPDFSIVYRSGVIYTSLRLIRSLINVFQRDPFVGSFNGEQLGVAFFLNDYRTLIAHSDRIATIRAVHLNGINLGFITRARGVRWVFQALFRGNAALRNADPSSNGKSRAIPLLGWLLYQHLASPLEGGTNPSKCVVTNIIHPLSLAQAFGFARRGVPVDFVEHAMTPRLAMRPLPIDDAYILSRHTVNAWLQALPTAGTRLHCLRDEVALQPRRYQLPTQPRVLICVNALDTFDAIESMLDAVIAVGGFATVRLHDAEARTSAVSSRAVARGARVSLALQSPISADLNTADLVICGNSNVLLDSLQRGKRVVYYWPNGSSGFDYYGCVGYYGVEFATSAHELSAMIAAMITTGKSAVAEARSSM